jgi:hypothetical protein
MSKPTPPTNPDATTIEGIAHNGKPCRVIDNTGDLNEAELVQFLGDLIEQKQFGIKGLSASDGTIKLGQPQATHIQFGETLYRLLLFPYEARIEAF